MFKKYNFFFFCIHRMGELHYAWETRSNSWITRWGSWTDQEEFFFFFYIHRMGGSYIMPLKHDRTAESHNGVYGGKKKNFFSSFTYTGWGVTLCLRNTIRQLNHELGFSDRRRRIFFLLLHTQDGGVTIMSIIKLPLLEGLVSPERLSSVSPLYNAEEKWFLIENHFSSARKVPLGELSQSWESPSSSTIQNIAKEIIFFFFFILIIEGDFQCVRGSRSNTQFT